MGQIPQFVTDGGPGYAGVPCLEPSTEYQRLLETHLDPKPHTAMMRNLFHHLEQPSWTPAQYNGFYRKLEKCFNGELPSFYKMAEETGLMNPGMYQDLREAWLALGQWAALRPATDRELQDKYLIAGLPDVCATKLYIHLTKNVAPTIANGWRIDLVSDPGFIDMEAVEVFVAILNRLPPVPFFANIAACFSLESLSLKVRDLCDNVLEGNDCLRPKFWSSLGPDDLFSATGKNKSLVSIMATAFTARFVAEINIRGFATAIGHALVAHREKSAARFGRRERAPQLWTVIVLLSTAHDIVMTSHRLLVQALDSIDAAFEAAVKNNDDWISVGDQYCEAVDAASKELFTSLVTLIRIKSRCELLSSQGRLGQLDLLEFIEETQADDKTKPPLSIPQILARWGGVAVPADFLTHDAVGAALMELLGRNETPWNGHYTMKNGYFSPKGWLRWKPKNASPSIFYDEKSDEDQSASQNQTEHKPQGALPPPHNPTAAPQYRILGDMKRVTFGEPLMGKLLKIHSLGSSAFASEQAAIGALPQQTQCQGHADIDADQTEMAAALEFYRRFRAAFPEL